MLEPEALAQQAAGIVRDPAQPRLVGEPLFALLGGLGGGLRRGVIPGLSIASGLQRPLHALALRGIGGGLLRGIRRRLGWFAVALAALFTGLFRFALLAFVLLPVAAFRVALALPVARFALLRCENGLVTHDIGEPDLVGAFIDVARPHGDLKLRGLPRATQRAGA